MYFKITNIVFSVLAVVLASCGGSSAPAEPEPDKPLFYQPENFPNAVYDFSKNEETEAGFQLGRKLFYDSRLSRDNTISCAECHNQYYAFTHHGHALSHGIDGQIGRRNAPAVQNTAFMKSFLWDGGVFNLDLFPIVPITNPQEMDESLVSIMEKLEKDEKYPDLFENAFGTKEITSDRFLKALSQFMNALISDNAKYDQYIRQENGVSLSASEMAGLKLYQAKCATCHASDLFTDGSYRNNGLEVFDRDPDYGRYDITEIESDKYKFKVPSLRNLKYTFPYMHDGRFNTLEEVLDHYSEGVMDTENLDPALKQNASLGIPLSDQDKQDLLAFLATLNDESFIRNPKFSAP
ncbi:c-type cytochrome [Marinilongibacter aquaticus]|uniref:cytochrome-c peroxidase n=1 Tax=Marinilongibacter aquaticus TaxID=2975157 RepID=UPI0021BDD41B|nr:cytochrome c peroxidase [Marinilongibacter aquaticus]UBM60432.1 c-type cytochrome [Marinilongibacter aquaticus]